MGGRLIVLSISFFILNTASYAQSRSKRMAIPPDNSEEIVPYSQEPEQKLVSENVNSEDPAHSKRLAIPPDNSDDFIPYSEETKQKLVNENVNSEVPEPEPYERPMCAGDTFTPRELLPVVERLLRKVDKPGQGKGFVSKESKPEELADKLFEAFFYTESRIMVLNDDDIPGLDALQALALSGEEANKVEFLAQDESEAETTTQIKVKGQVINIKKPKKCQYKLLTKIDYREPETDSRRGIALAKKLNKNRHLVIKPGRKNSQSAIFAKGNQKYVREAHKKSKVVGTSSQGTTKSNRKTRKSKAKKGVTSKGRKETINKAKQKAANKKSSTVGKSTGCHWMYECRDPGDLDTCDLKTQCSTQIEFHGIKHREDEHTPELRRFRKMLGITLVDEEVEKILEQRHASKDKQPLLMGKAVATEDRLESIAEYFKKVIMANYKEFKSDTTPMSPNDRDDDSQQKEWNRVLENGYGDSQDVEQKEAKPDENEAKQ